MGKRGEKSPGKVKNRVDPMEAGRGKGWVIADIPGASNLARRENSAHMCPAFGKGNLI